MANSFVPGKQSLPASIRRPLPLKLAAVLAWAALLLAAPASVVAAPTTVVALPASTTGAVAPLLAEGGFSHWWLTPDYSTHGHSIDWLFYLIFWITTIVFVLVEAALIYFLIKYRYRKDRTKAIFTHGNTRLEMAWTLAPAVILLVIALLTKRSWDTYRFPPYANNADRVQVLVVGEQFKWNVVYPGPDKELGTYLSYPKPTDPKYRAKSWDDALKAINNDVAQNPLGQVIHPDKKVPDPGRDDDMSKLPGRPLIVPVESGIDVHLTSKDVLHDFFLPNFRVKLDAVPGLRGHIYFVSRPEGQSTEPFSLAQAPADKPIWLDLDTPGVELGGNPKRFQIYDATDKKKGARRRVWLMSMESLNDGARKRLQRRKVTSEQMEEDPTLLINEVEAFRNDLAALGIKQVSVITKAHEIVCEELCGLGHYTMRGDMYVVSKREYENFINKEAPAGGSKPPKAPAQPVAAAEPAAP